MQKFSLLTLLLFVICFTRVTDLGAQRSLYQDAITLAQAAPKGIKDSSMILEFKTAPSANEDLLVFTLKSVPIKGAAIKTDTTFTIYTDTTMVIDADTTFSIHSDTIASFFSYAPREIDTTYFPLDTPLKFALSEDSSYYRFLVDNASAGDSLIVRYGQTTTTIDLSVLRFPEGTPDRDKVAPPVIDFTFIESEKGQGIIDSLKISRRVYKLTEKIYTYNDAFTKAIDNGGDPASVITILRQNIRLREGLRLPDVRMEDLRQYFATNPFINVDDLFPELRKSEDFLLSDFSQPPRGQDLYSAYPYLRILKGDLTLANDELNVGVDDVSSYRQRIVTAQNRLEDANSAFERQRKKGGLLDVNTVAVGLSDFIAERAQEELNLTFFNRFKENLAKDSELTVLFPATHRLLDKFEISNYKVFLAHARETFNADLDNLGLSISGILNLPKYQRFKNDPNVFNLALIYDIANAAYQEKTVEEIILTTHQRLLDRQQNLSESINQAIADSLYRGRSPDEPPVFPFREDMQQYFREIEDLSRSLNNTIAALSEPAGDTIFAAFADQVRPPPLVLKRPDRPAFTTSSLTGSNPENDAGEEVETTNPQLVQRLARTALKLAEAPDYGPKRIRYHGERIDTSHIKHDINFINAYLEGHDFYGYYLLGNSPLKRQRLEVVSQEEPMSYLAKGLDRSRKFLDIPFEELSREHYDAAVSVKTVLEAKQQAAFDDIKESFDINMRRNFGNARFQLLRQMTLELGTLQRAVGKSIESDRFLVALELLRKEVKTKIQRRPEESRLVNGSYLTKVRFVNGDNRVLDRLEQEWEHMMSEAMAYHGDRTSKIGPLVLNPDHVPNEAGEEDYWYGSGIKIELEKEVLDYYLFSPANPQKLSVREVLTPRLGIQMDEYRIARFNINEMKTNALLGFEEVDSLLQKNEQRIVALGQRRRRLQHKLDSLEMATVPNLVKARRNAKALTSALELSAHALFAFRDYSQLYDTLYFLDTQRVEITVQNTDLKTGLVRTFKKDSFLVEQTPVPGTTDPIPVAQWITRQQFDAMRRNPQEWNLFLGLLYQRLNQVEDVPQFSPRGVATLARQFLTIANEIQESQNKLRFKKGIDPRKVGVKEYFPFIRSTVDLLNIVLTTPILGDSTAIRKRASALGKITQISNEALSLYENIDVRDYGNAILNATELLRIITNREYTEAELDAMGKEERKRRASTQRQVAAIFKYGTFMAEMINAKSSDQVKNILKSTTLPPGSSRIKREVQSSITINAYLGAGLGRDRLLDAPMDIDADAFGVALSVPIGLTYSFSPKFLRNRSSFSIHVPLLDLGAITAYRSNPNGQTANVDALPELEWKNLFSPGAYLIYNFADSPFSLGIGGQYGPQLRELNQANGEPIFLNSFRFPMISATIDVPFYNLHTGPRKIKVK